MLKPIASTLILAGGLASCAEPKAVCMFDQRVQSIELESSGSHADASRKLRIDVATRKLSGRSFTSDGDTFQAVNVDRQLSEPKWERLRPALAAICGVPAAVDTPSDVGGGSSTWTVTTPDSSTAFSVHSPGPHPRWVQLTPEQHESVHAVWPKDTP